MRECRKEQSPAIKWARIYLLSTSFSGLCKTAFVLCNCSSILYIPSYFSCFNICSWQKALAPTTSSVRFHQIFSQDLKFLEFFHNLMAFNNFLERIISVVKLLYLILVFQNLPDLREFTFLREINGPKS